MVGGAAVYPSKNIVERAVNSKDHNTLVAAVNSRAGRDAPGRRTALRCLHPQQRFFDASCRNGRQPPEA